MGCPAEHRSTRQLFSPQKLGCPKAWTEKGVDCWEGWAGGPVLGGVGEMGSWGLCLWASLSEASVLPGPREKPSQPWTLQNALQGWFLL